MDRTLRKGTVGLTLAWLAAGGEVDKLDHTGKKAELSSEAGLHLRQACRDAFRKAAADDPEALAILQAEKLARDGGDLEPLAIACPPSLRSWLGH